MPMSESDFFIPGQTPIQNDINYTQGYLKTQIGKFVRVEFLLGTNTIVDRSGILEKSVSAISYSDKQERAPKYCVIFIRSNFVNIFEERTNEFSLS
jgi:hypothetical protein